MSTHGNEPARPKIDGDTLNPNEPAYPFHSMEGYVEGHRECRGLTKRERIASEQLSNVPCDWFETTEQAADYAINRADVLLRRLKETEGH